LKTFPQVLLNLRVRERRDWMTIPEAAQAIADVEARLGGRGRLLVRYSGTEPLLRVMIEGERQAEINAWAAHIVDAVRAAIGE
jgi:phosphoglucosamine mutase